MQMSQDQYMKEQMALMKQFAKQKKKMEEEKVSKGFYKFKDDDPVIQYDLKNLQLDKNGGDYALANNLEFTITPLRRSFQVKKGSK